MPNAEEIEIIEGLRAGGIQRQRFENMLWKRFSYFMHWGVTRYNLSKDEIQQAYADAILCIIDNIISSRYKDDSNALLKTYAATIFHYKCVDRIHKTSKTSIVQSQEKLHLINPQPIKESLLDMLPDQVKNVVETMIQREEQSKMRKCLENIGKICKDLLELFAGGYKDKEIAEMMNYNTSDVAKQRRYHCMEKLRQNYLNLYKHE